MARKPKIGLVENTARGIDLLVERDAGNEVLILTGNTEHSLEFWQRLYTAAEEAIQELKLR